MRLNFSPVSHDTKIRMPDWISILHNEWLTEYCIDTTYINRAINEYKWSPAGTRHFADWLRQQSFKVDYWEIDYIPPSDTNPIAYGIMFDENCPRFIEEVLKQ